MSLPTPATLWICCWNESKRRVLICLCQLSAGVLLVIFNKIWEKAVPCILAFPESYGMIILAWVNVPG